MIQPGEFQSLLENEENAYQDPEPWIPEILSPTLPLYDAAIQVAAILILLNSDK